MEREKYQGLDVYTVEEFQEMLNKGETVFRCMRVVGKPSSYYLSIYTPYTIFMHHCSFERISWKLCGTANFEQCNLENVIFENGKPYLSFSQCNLLFCSFLGGNGSLKFLNSVVVGTEIREMDLTDIQCENTKFQNFEFRKNLTDGTLFKISNCAFAAPMWICCEEFEQAMKQVNKIPTDGSFIAWKKAILLESKDGTIPVLVKLEIPADAKRIGTSVDGKCRANKAKVLAITSMKEDEEYQEAYSWYNSNFCYKVGETVKVDNFNQSPFITCGSGIHFFLNKEMAKRYNI